MLGKHVEKEGTKWGWRLCEVLLSGSDTVGPEQESWGASELECSRCWQVLRERVSSLRVPHGGPFHTLHIPASWAVSILATHCRLFL